MCLLQHAVLMRVAAVNPCPCPNAAASRLGPHFAHLMPLCFAARSPAAWTRCCPACPHAAGCLLPATHYHLPLVVCSEITGGVDQTLPRLLQLLKPHLEVAPLKPLRVQCAQVGA